MKNKIGLMTDSSSDLSKDVFNNSQIEFLPLKIIYNDGEYLDKVNISPEDVYQRFNEEIPTTSMPGPDEFKEKFKEFKKRGYTHIISIHISSGLSSTPEICKMVSKEFDALALAVTGMIGVKEGFKTIPENPEKDSRGINMEMVYAG